MKKLIVFLFVLLLLVNSAWGYCNETKIITHDNESLASADYNVTITKECTPEYNNSSFLIVAIIFMFVTGLVVLGLFFSKKMWLKVVLTVALSLMLTSLLRFSSWFISITNPAEVNLIGTLDFFYSIGVRSLYFLIAGAMLFLVIIIINAIRDRPGKKREKEWHTWGEDE